MDTYELSEHTRIHRKKKSPSLVWNVLTILVLVTMVCIVSVFFLIYVNPYSGINPFPPPTLNTIHGPSDRYCHPAFHPGPILDTDQCSWSK